MMDGRYYNRYLIKPSDAATKILDCHGRKKQAAELPRREQGVRFVVSFYHRFEIFF